MRGFFSMDALFALTLLMLVCSSLLHVYEGRMEAAREISWGLEARMVGEELAGAINAVYSGGPGLELRLKLPERPLILSFDGSGGIVVRGERGEVRVGTVCNNVENFLLLPENLRRTLRVYWEENRIRVVGE